MRDAIDMQDDERDVAQSLVDWLIGGDEQIPAQLGSLTCHSVVRYGRSLIPPSCKLRVKSAPDHEEYEVEIVARRIR